MSAPRVVIVHYHLRRGGVTHVIQNAVAALATEGIDTLICSGSPPPDGVSFACPVHVAPELGYSDTPPSNTAADVIQSVCTACHNALGGAPDVWHIHNHALGKNASVPLLVDSLARRGQPMLLQIHDFAEDGRPGNYQLIRKHILCHPDRPALYPYAPNVLYAALNHRDMTRLQAAGLTQATVLHNPVVPPALDPDVTPSAPLVLYPTRAIRRKNLGEFLLWAALRPEAGPYGVTLAPENPRERVTYDKWVALAEELALPVQFEMGSREPFGHLLGRATALMTTSIAEGFGLAFVEPWLCGKPLLGRNLPDITSDFADQGIALDTLYSELTVPAAWIDRDALNQRIEGQLEETFNAYNRDVTAADRSDAVRASQDGDRLRFGHLDEQGQEQILRHCAGSPASVQDVNPGALQVASNETVHANAERVRDAFSLPAYGARLRTIYTSLVNAPADAREALDPASVLRQFLSATRFVLLRS